MEKSGIKIPKFHFPKVFKPFNITPSVIDSRKILLNVDIKEIDTYKSIDFFNLIVGKKYIFTGEYQNENEQEIAKFIGNLTLELSGGNKYIFFPKEFGKTLKDILKHPRLEYFKIEKNGYLYSIQNENEDIINSLLIDITSERYKKSIKINGVLSNNTEFVSKKYNKYLKKILYIQNPVNKYFKIYNSTHEITKEFKINHIIKLDNNIYILINEKNNLILLSPTYFEIYNSYIC